MNRQSVGASVNINQLIVCKNPAPVYLKRYKLPPLSASHSNQSWQHGFLCNFLFQVWIPKTWGRRECREACRPLLNNPHVNRALLWAILYLLTLPTEWNTVHFWKAGSKRKDIIWLNRSQWVHLFLEETQCGLSFKLRIPWPWCVFLHEWVTLRADILPKQGQATGTAGFLMKLEPSIYLLLSRSPSGRPRRSYREGSSPCSPLPWAKGSEQWASDLLCDPSLILWLGLVGVSKDSCRLWGKHQVKLQSSPHSPVLSGIEVKVLFSCYC